MTFYISKIFWLLAQPLSLALLLLIAGLLAGLLKWNRIRTWASVASALVLFLTLFTSTGAVLLQVLEDRVPRAELPAGGPACIITLGGSFESEVVTARGGFEMAQAGDRFVETLRLALDFPQARILISGGDGSLSGAYEGDAVIGPRFFEAFGVPATRLIRETESRDTYENAGNTQDLLRQNNLENCLLVTSAFHMPRSVGLFHRADFPVVPWPADYLTTGREGVAIKLDEIAENLSISTLALREWIGLAGYYATGKIDALLPAPLP